MKIKKVLLSIFVLSVLAAATLLSINTFSSVAIYGEEINCQVLATSCSLYTQPSFSDENNDYKVKDEDGNAIFFSNGDMLTILSGGVESEDFLYVQGEKGGKNYAGYIYKYLVTFNLGQEQEVYPEFNAKVVNNDVQVYDLEENPTNITLSKGTKLYLYKGYHKKDRLTAVCFVNNDGHLYYGYLDTDDLEPNGISATVITGIVVAASCITIILLLVFMKSRKKKKSE